jgi:LysM repeat protein
MLFVSALKSEPQGQVAFQDKKEEKYQPIVKKETPLAKSNSDQVDQILAKYAKKEVKEAVKEEKKVEGIEAPKLTEAVSNKGAQEKVERIAMEHPPAQKERPIEKQILPKMKETSSEEVVKVIVKKGDVLEKIAKNYGTTVGALMQANQLTDSRLQIGQELCIPKEKQVVNAHPIKALPQLDEKYYVVKNGDNLWKIAIENHLKVEDLLKLNQLNEKQAKALRPGDKLRIK